MEEEAMLALALQLIALGCVVSALVLYLLCKVRNDRRTSSGGELVFNNIGGGRAVLITSADNLLGIHLAYYLSTRGFRVFAGLKPSGEEEEKSDILSSTPKKILESKWKHFEASCKKEEPQTGSFGSLVVLPLDVTREDLLHEAVGTIRRYLPAGEEGLWAVINTAGVSCRGHYEGQDTSYWDAIVKLNVTGTLKVSRTFMPLLRSKKGRLINLGAQVSQQEDVYSLAAHTAGRYAVEGASAALRHEMRPLGIKVVTLRPEGLPIARLFATPTIINGNNAEVYLQCDIRTLPERSLDVVEEALLSENPHDSYSLSKPAGLLAFTDRLLNGKTVQVV